AVVGVAAARGAGQPAPPDVTTARALLDGLGVPVQGAAAVSERIYRPCADEVDEWAASQGLAGGGPWVCVEPTATEHTAAPVGDCSNGWLTSDGVEVG